MSKNNVGWSLSVVAVSALACTTAQQSASGSTSTSPSPGAGVTSTAQPNAAPSTSPDAPNAGADVRALPAGNIAVTDVASQAVGSKVTVAGVFMGFNGACLTDAPSRSAWHLSASKEPKAPCVYVDGPFPDGLSPAVHAGTPTTVIGTVTALGNTPYLVSGGQ